MLSAMGPSAVTAIRMPSDGRRTSGAAVPPEEESEGLCAGALMGTAGMWTAGWRIWAVARKNAAEADGRRSAMQPAIWGRRLRLSTAMARQGIGPSPPRRGSERAEKGRRWPSGRRAAPDDPPKGGYAPGGVAWLARRGPVIRALP